MKLLKFASDSAVAADVARDLVAALTCEQEVHTIENMVGDVPWSMLSWLRTKSRLTSKNGGISAAYDGTQLIGICGHEQNDLIFSEALQFGMRLWVHPDRRGQFIPSKLIAPALEYAEAQCMTAWTSFNMSRFAMLRMIDIRSKSGDSLISTQWTGFKTLPDRVLLNNVEQYIAFKDFAPT